MKLEISVHGAGSYTTLFDESVNGPVLKSFQPSVSALCPSFDMFDAANKTRVPLGNLECVLSLTFRQSYSTYAAAMSSFVTFIAYLSGSWDIKVTEGTTVHIYANANGLSWTPSDWTGVAVDHSITFHSDAPTVSP